VDAAALAAALQQEVRGEVRFDAGSRALYSTDGSNDRQVPIGVVIPQDKEDLTTAIGICREHGAPILPRGGGTSLAGQCCNVAVVFDTSKYFDRLIALDPVTRRARIEPGIVLDDLRHAAEKHHLTFGPDPATHNHCTLGGMMGNNSCGIHSIMAGRTSDNVEELEILTYDGLRLRVGQTSEEELRQIIAAGGRRGQIYAGLESIRDRYADLIRERFPKIPRRVSGYNLDELLPENGFHVARALVGTEGTCVTILEATVRLVPSPPARSLLVLGYPDIYSAGDHIPELMAHHPIGLEGIDINLVRDMKKKGLHPGNVKLLPEGEGWLLVEFGGQNRAESDAHAHTLMAALAKKPGAPSMKLFDDPKQETIVWQIRESGLGATARVPGEPDTWEGWEDSAVPPDKVGPYLRDLRRLFQKYDYNCSLYGHLGQGCIHTRIDFDLMTAPGIAHFRAFLEEASDLVLSYGGSLSGEHGDGQSRAELLPKMFGAELVQAFGEFKAIWDPTNKMNPHKVVEPYQITENLRLGADYNPPPWPTHFHYPDDDGSFARGVLRCVGVGECRRMEKGTMCPSYRATREEMHSTRGRARLLFEMLEGDPLEDGWKSPHVKDALDLCLACKGCKGDCPVNVDMATYKAEFLSHYYEHRPRPITAYSMGLISVVARAASHAPELVNLFTRTPGLRSLTKRLGGIAPEREIPKFARLTFKEWFRRRPAVNAGHPPVVLWPDTFNNYFLPNTAIAAVEVLEAAGFQVLVPKPWLCCGRPLYDYGMLDTAKRWLNRTVDNLKPQIESGIPVVGLEPSCVAVFRDELVSLMPHHADAKRLAGQTFLFSEFLDKHAPDFHPPALQRRALLHGHCHQKALFGMDADEAVLERIGLDHELLDSGCCGMAGAFGYEKDKYEISQQIGELVLLPAVRRASPDTLLVADGFSCREQVTQATGRPTLHLAEAVRLALHRGER
jgi:FAD/FMN-containing dehydrogenase/Fe-S oxidoreductase